jgi:hypothetical protein
MYKYKSNGAKIFFTFYIQFLLPRTPFRFFLEIIFLIRISQLEQKIFFTFLHLYKIKFLYLIRDSPRIFFFFFVQYLISFETILKSSLFLEPFCFCPEPYFFVFPFYFFL